MAYIAACSWQCGMEQIHEHVTISASQYALPQAAAASADSTAVALQFVAVNAGFAAVHFRADFRDSSNVQLALPSPQHQPCHQDLKYATTAVELAFDCELLPLERRVIAYALKIPKQRAFVRVRYTVNDVKSLALDDLERAQKVEAAALDQKIRNAHESLSRIRQDWLKPVSLPDAIMVSFCVDINRFFGRENDQVFVDSTFSPGLRSLLGDASEREGNTKHDRPDGAASLYALCTWKQLPDVLDTSWVFAVDEKKTRTPTKLLPQFCSPIPGHDSFLCALACLFSSPHRKRKWLMQLFGLASLSEYDLRRQSAIRVQMCEYGMQWKHVVIDLFLPGFPIGNGLMAVSSASTPSEVFPILLQKAYAKLKGSYAVIGSLPTLQIIREFSGLPWVQVYRSAELSGNNPHAEDATSTSALQALLCRRLPRRYSNNKQQDQSTKNASRVFIVSFGAIDNHHCAFPLLSCDRRDGVEVQDAGDSVRSTLKRSTGVPDGAMQHNEKSSLAVSWSAFFALSPRVWMLLRDHSESKHQRVKVARKRDAESRHQFQFAFGVAELSQVVIVVQHQGGSAVDAASTTLELTLESVEHDFSSSKLLTASANSAVVWSADIVESQITTSLGPGEYVLTIEIDTTKTQDDKKDNHDSLPPAHTQQTTEKNLALLFECLDQDMDGVISSAEIFTFLELREHVELDNALVDRFMDQFGTSLDSVPSPSASKGLLLDDLRDVYLLLAVEDQDPSSADDTSHHQQERYAELIWQDLHVLLHGNTEGAAEAMEVIEELRCCIHSADKSPITSLVVLPSTFS
ncbi:Peptidase c2, calpain, catalytic domain, partial [Globisporangium splendens]